MNDLNEEDFWRELFVIKMRREERRIAALQANPAPTSMQRPMICAASGSSPASLPEEEKRIWTEGKLPWIALNPELPKYPQAKS
jgi:hypothetical protein